jgi:hypothetical protein
MNVPTIPRVPAWVLPIGLAIGALLLFDIGRYVVSGILSAVILMFVLAIVVLLVGLLVTLALPSRRNTPQGDVPATTSDLIADYFQRLAAAAGRAPWRRPGRVMAGAAQQVRAQVAQLPTGRVAFSNVEARMSSRTLDRLDAWMPVEDLAYQLASDYARAHRELPRTSRAITIVLIQDDSVPQNRVRARGSFRTPTDPRAVALARCTLLGPLAHGEADRAQHTVLRIEEPEPLDVWLAPGRDGSTRLDPDRTVSVPATAQERSPRPRTRDSVPAVVPASGRTLIAETPPSEAQSVRLAPSADAPTVRLAPSADAPTLRMAPTADAPTVRLAPGLDAPTLRFSPRADAATPLTDLETEAIAPVPVRGVNEDLRLFRIDPRTGEPTGELPVLVSADQAAVGRAAGSDVWLGERHVSRTHAQLDRMESGWTVTDVGSTWGTFVNGQPVVSGQPHHVSKGDVVEFGRPSDRAAATKFLVG